MTDHSGRDYARTEDTHPITLALPSGLLTSNQVSSKRKPIPRLPLKGFEIEKLLTQDECSALVGIVEKTGFKSISWEYDPVCLILYFFCLAGIGVSILHSLRGQHTGTGCRAVEASSASPPS